MYETVYVTLTRPVVNISLVEYWSKNSYEIVNKLQVQNAEIQLIDQNTSYKSQHQDVFRCENVWVIDEDLNFVSNRCLSIDDKINDNVYIKQTNSRHQLENTSSNDQNSVKKIETDIELNSIKVDISETQPALQIPVNNTSQNFLKLADNESQPYKLADNKQAKPKTLTFSKAKFVQTKKAPAKKIADVPFDPEDFFSEMTKK